MQWPSLLLLVPLAGATLYPASDNAQWHKAGSVFADAGFYCPGRTTDYPARAAVSIAEGGSTNLTFRGISSRTRYTVDCMFPMGAMDAVFHYQLDDRDMGTYYTTSADEGSFQCMRPVEDEIAGEGDHVLKIWVPVQGLNAVLTLIGAEIIDQDATTSDAPTASSIVPTTSDTPAQNSRTSTETLPRSSTPMNTSSTGGGPAGDRNGAALPNAAIVGLAIGAVALALVPIAILLFCRCRRRSRSRRDKSTVAYAVPTTSATPTSTGGVLLSDKGEHQWAVLGDEAREKTTPYEPDASSGRPVASSSRASVKFTATSTDRSSPGVATSSSTTLPPEPEIRELYAAMCTAGFTTQSLFDRLRNRRPEEQHGPVSAVPPQYE